jgi:hypothetical protein
MLLPSDSGHLPSEKGDLRRQWQIFRANVVAAEERHAAEHAVVVADQFVEILIAPLIPGIDAETGDLIQSRCADKVFAHAHGAAARDAATALDTAVKLVDLLRQLRAVSLIWESFSYREVAVGQFISA